MDKDKKILPKISYNGLDKNWIEDRTISVVKSTFLDVNSLEKSGRDLNGDLKMGGFKEAPRRFVQLDI